MRILAHAGRWLQGEGVVRSTTDFSMDAAAGRDRPWDPRSHVHEPGGLEPIIRSDRAGPRLQFFSARGFEWIDAQLPIPGLPQELDGFRILHLSDFHARPVWDKAYDDLISRTNADPPDLIAFTGDFVEDKHDHRRVLPIVRKLLNSLTSRLGAVTILGNHDGDLLGPPLASLNLTLVDHRCLSLHSGSATLELIGIAGVERKDFDPIFLHSLGPKKPNTVRVALSHYPDLIRKTRFLNADLFLAGHTHGGQICFPGKIPIIRHDSLPAKFIGGINRYHETWLVVNRGLGFSSIPVRINCPAEVIEIRLRKAGAS
jgi:predicted MPP superfamily phosphohydrolase